MALNIANMAFYCPNYASLTLSDINETPV